MEVGCLRFCFSSNTIQQSATPYSTQQQTVEIEMPEPAKSFLRFGGGVVAVLGTSSLVFWELANKKRRPKHPMIISSLSKCRECSSHAK